MLHKPRILIAPACFKGSLSAVAVAEVIQNFLMQRLGSSVVLDCCPIADGGDDTLTVLQTTERQTIMVTGPTPTMQVQAGYLVHVAQSLVVIEAAQAHGLALLPANQFQPMTATSYGVGQILRHVLQTIQPRHIVITLGGSASTDAGMGALQALGVQFLNEAQTVIDKPLGGEALLSVQSIQWPATWPAYQSLQIATDVTNPLLGPLGTARVFAPQKGATPSQCERLESGISRIALCMAETTGIQHSALSGTGAAGGLAYGLRYLPHAEIISGSQWVATQLNLAEKLAAADCVITGEGRFDATSLAGKGTGHLLRMAGDKPVLMLCGQAQARMDCPDNVSIYPLVGDPADAQAVAEAIANPKAALLRRLEAAWPDWSARLL